MDETQVAYRFGDWSVEPNLNRISKDGVEHQVEPLTMGVLAYLLARSGELATSDELLDQLWGDRHGDPGMIQKRIAQLRRILGDEATNPSYIETIRKRGYRTVASVAEVAPGKTVHSRLMASLEARTPPFAAYDGDGPYVFACYAHGDREVVFPELAKLRDAGVNVWYDEGIGPGSDWTEDLADAIDRCAQFFYFVSDASVASENCRGEVQYALNRGKPLLPVYLAPTELTGGLELAIGPKQGLFKYQMKEEDYERKVAAFLDPSERAKTGFRLLAKRTRYPVLAIVCLAAVVLGTGSWLYFQNDPRETMGELEPLAPEAPASRNSIAVLPFENLSNLSENAFFAAGMQEDILNSLAHIPELLVTSRTTTLRYIDSDLSLPEIAAELNVAYIMEGSVRRVGDEVRISVQLIDAATDKHIWTRPFDRTVQDVFAIQTEVADLVARELQLKIVNEWRDQKPTDSAVAYDLFLRGRELASEFSTSSLDRALKLHESAIEVDPGFADAYAGKAEALAMKAHYYPSQWQAQRAQAFAAAEKALELDPESAEANLGMGSLLTAPAEARYGEAVPYLRRAVSKNPNDTLSRFYLMIAYSFLQQKDEMSVQAYEIYRRDPFSTRGNIAMAFALALKSKPDETRMHLSRALQPDHLAPYWYFVAGRASWWAGDYHAAAHHLHSALELDPAYAWARKELVMVFMYLGDQEAADRWLRKSEAEPSAEIGVEFFRLLWYRSEKRVDDYVAYADAWLERAPANPMARWMNTTALALRAEESYRRGDSETWRRLAEESFETQLAALRGPNGEIRVVKSNVTPVSGLAAAAARLGEKSLAEDLCRRILQLYVSQETPLHLSHPAVARAKALLGRPQEAVEHLEEYFEAGQGFVLAIEPMFNDTHGVFHELPAMASDRDIQNKMVARNEATILRIREDYPALFKD